MHRLLMLCAFLRAAVAFADEPALETLARTGREVAIVARVAHADDESFVPGRKAQSLVVYLENHDRELAIALRSVAWRGFLPKLDWHRKLYGATREVPGGTYAHDRLAQRLTDLSFELGLVLPGESIRVPLPLHVQPRTDAELEVAFVVVGDARRTWHEEVLIPREENSSDTVYGAPTTEGLERRRAEGGGPALARSTMKAGYLPLGEGAMTFRARLSLAPAATAKSRTGGLSAVEAAERAGVRLDDDTFVYFDPLLKEWFFIAAERRRCVRLSNAGGEWTASTLSVPMHPSAPTLFGADGEGNTYALLAADAFAGVVSVAKPTFNDVYFDPGATTLSPRELAKVLDRAEERGLGVDVVTVDPNGLGIERYLAIGVEVDARGRGPGGE